MFWRWTGSITWSAIRRRHPAGDGTGEALFFRSRNSLGIDGEDEIGAAATRALKERYPDDKVKQQQEMMESQEGEDQPDRVSSVALQIPVFFSLYKVLFVTIECTRVLRLDQGPVGARPDNLLTCSVLLHFDPTTVPLFGHYLRSAYGRSSWASRLVPDEAQSDAAGSDPEMMSTGCR